MKQSYYIDINIKAHNQRDKQRKGPKGGRLHHVANHSTVYPAKM